MIPPSPPLSSPSPSPLPLPSLSPPPLLVARGLEVVYGTRGQSLGQSRGGFKALHGVDLAVGRGETVGLVGESGSGKSTLGRALLRLTDIAAGSLHFDGVDITRHDPARMRPLRRRMQLIFQDPMASLNPRRKIGQILTEPVLFHRLATDAAAAGARVGAFLDRVGLAQDCLARYPHELSGGQRQRVGIARSLLLSPDFVLADEIVSGLDVSTQAQVLSLLKGLCRDMGLALVFISHDLSVVRAICERVIILRFGRVVEEGPCDAVFAAPKSRYTRALLDAIPLPQIDPGWLERGSLAQDQDAAL